MPWRRLQIGHTTVVAYLALFLALGGSALAARHYLITSTRQIKPSVLKKLVGPRGPAGKDGTNGTNGATGPTVLTSPPSYEILPGSTVAINGLGNGPNEEWQSYNLYTFTTVTTPETATFRTYLLSPSQLAGSADHLASVDFCYGLQNSSLGAAQPASLSITHATVSEFTEPDAPTSSGTPNAATPVYSTSRLIDQPLSINGTAAGSSTCQTITPQTPPAIVPGGYLALDVQASFTAPSAPATSNGHPYQGWLYFGRVSTSFSP
jgi:hypothetical protein